MSDSPLEIDLKFLPDWLKEPANKNPYADFAGESEDRYARRDYSRSPGGPRGSGRPGGPGRPGGSGRPGGGPRDSRDSRGPSGQRSPQNRGSQSPQGQGTGSNKAPEAITIPQRPPGAPPRPPLRSSQNRDNRQGGGFQQRAPRDNQDNRDRAGGDSADVITIPLHVEIVPEANGIAALAKQIRSSHRAFPLYGLGRMFLNKPERHRVRVTSNAPAHPLYQVGEDGPVTLNRQSAEREAFRTLKSAYYTEESVQTETPKGNYSNVARCRLSGVLLGPTNHHGYQPALRRLFDSRFSRRMDFNEFLRQVEVVNDPAVVEEWKKQVSSVTVFRTVQEAEPIEFKSAQEVDTHFRETYLPKAIRSGRTLEMSGIASRDVSDRDVRNAIRTAWEKERGFPAQIVNQIRPRFMDAGLHIWKYRKRILFVSTVRPVRFGEEAKNVSEHIANILNVIETVPKCTRAEISNHLLKPHEAEEEFPKLKAALASDLHWLIESGHIIEFHDGTLDLPLLPKDLAKEALLPESAQQESAESAPQAEASPEVSQVPDDEAPAGDTLPVEAVVDDVATEGPIDVAPVVPIESQPVTESTEPATLTPEKVETASEPAPTVDATLETASIADVPPVVDQEAAKDTPEPIVGA